MTSPQAETASPVVYLVDDNPDDVQIIQRLCESVGLAVRCFSSPQKFLSEFDADQPGCVVSDLLMPEMTGLQLFQELNTTIRDIPVIIMTAHADAMTCRRALQAGVFDFVEKSFNPHDLLVVIQGAIERDARRHDSRIQRQQDLKQLDLLSKREVEVMRLLADGLALKDIASDLGISVQTASKHRGSIFEKLAVTNEVDLLRLLIRIDPESTLGAEVIAA